MERVFFIVTSFFVLLIFSFVQGQQSLQYLSDSVFIVPEGATAEVLVEAWGAGGGGGLNAKGVQQGGGGGGAYASSLLELLPGTYHIQVGQGGRPGENGGKSFFFIGDSILVSAEGGYSGDDMLGFSGGMAAQCIGDVSFSGGNGGHASRCGAKNKIINPGGGGGGSAFTYADGENGEYGYCPLAIEHGLGGYGGVGTGPGGIGGSNGNAIQSASQKSGRSGIFPGGGGGGKATGKEGKSGIGADGLIRITYDIVFADTLLLENIKNVEGNAELSWISTSNISIDYFHVEYSYNGGEFEVIGIIKSKNSVQSFEEYGYIHVRPKKGMNYYRLKQVNMDGHISYSKVKSLTIADPNYSYDVYPNPATNEIQVDFKRNAEGKVTLFNGLGKEMNVPKIMSGMGVTLDISQLLTGMYFVQIETTGNHQIRQVFKN